MSHIPDPSRFDDRRRKDGMKRVLFTTGWRSKREFAYSRAIRAGDFVFVSGTTGYDYENDVMPEDPAEQADRALSNIDAR